MNVETTASPGDQSIPSMQFTGDGIKGVQFPHNDPLVVTMDIARFEVWRIFFDGGSSADILFTSAFNEMGIRRDELVPISYPVINFTGQTVHPIGTITLPVQFGEGTSTRSISVEFLVMDILSPYNAIVG